MQREDKQLDISVEVMINKLTELKNQLTMLLYKVEHERDKVTWPIVMDNFMLASAQLASIKKILASDKISSFRSLTVLPLYLSQDRDDSLYQMTEERVPAFSHEVVPDYLRTKPEPEVEKKISSILHKANSLSVETGQKQTAAFNKAVSHVLDIVNKAREDLESDMNSRPNVSVASSLNDTHALISAVSMGKGLKPTMTQGVTPGPPGMMPASVRPNTAQVPASVNNTTTQNTAINPNQSNMNIMGKAPTIKTNIKSASQIHQYR